MDSKKQHGEKWTARGPMWGPVETMQIDQLEWKRTIGGRLITMIKRATTYTAETISKKGTTQGKQEAPGNRSEQRRE